MDLGLGENIYCTMISNALEIITLEVEVFELLVFYFSPVIYFLFLPRNHLLQCFLSLFAAMVGDVNIYMNDPDDPQMAEIEIMIAKSKWYFLYFLLAI